jgi:predicted esterase
MFLSVYALSAALESMEAADTNAVALERRDVQFSQSAPYATGAEIQRRFRFSDTPPAYDISQEKFRLIVPDNYSTNSAWGLLVWISPADSPQIRPDWEPELAAHRMLLVSAYNSGNDRNAMDRLRLALDAACNVCRQFKIDRQRIFVSGFSGGARLASMLGVAYADIFTGTFCVCGVNFYRDVPAGANQIYPASYAPHPRVLALAKKSGRFVLLTGDNDFNRDNTKAMLVKGFRPDGFSQAIYREVPGMKHAIPGPAELNTALKYLAGSATNSGGATPQSLSEEAKAAIH